MTAKERQLLFLLVRQLSEAQFVRADRLRSDRLWQEVGALGFDPDLVLSLLYGGHDPAEPGVLDDLEACLQAQAAAAGPRQARRPTGFRWGWGLKRRRPAAAHRSAPPAATPARQGVR
ncbi:MAG: hypothetical protein ER33_11190 [Cyanobium sp. CACIAM 14]|nr:MAG: hypothetical protein ER33_11190 [Cyanobium sp. CACIAM 14]